MMPSGTNKQTNFYENESSKSIKIDFISKYPGPYGRVADEVYASFVRECGVSDKQFGGKHPDALRKIQEQLMDSEFMLNAKAVWDQQTKSGNVNKDPEVQEKLWADGLVRKIKDEMSFLNQ